MATQKEIVEKTGSALMNAMKTASSAATDSRLTGVMAEKNQAMSDLEQTYNGMVDESKKFYDDQIKASQSAAASQMAMQQQQTDFAIQQINQQKAQTTEDYTREQSGAYVDWQKESNKYGVNAEQMASAGLANSGYSESSQVSMYNTYQNRVATARESYNLAIQNYNNAITQAQLANSAAMAAIAQSALQQQLELSLEGFQYQNQLLLEKENQKMQVTQMYQNAYKDILDQINTERAFAESVRQYDQDYALSVQKQNEAIRQFNADQEYRYAQLAQQKDIANAQLAEEKRQYDLAYAASQAKSSSSGSISRSSGSSGSSSKSSNNTARVNRTDVADVYPSTKSSSEANTMKSILDLGYGPISANTLNSLVQSGKVEEYSKNGTTLFRNASSNKASKSTSVMTNKYKNALTIK